MKTRVRALGHPVHPMVIVFPLALLLTATVFDLIALGRDDGAFDEAGYWNIAAGIIGAVVAALTGLLDWTAIPAGTRAKRIGLLHAAANTVVLLLFVISWLTRIDNTNHAASAGSLVVQVLAVLISGVAAWFGGELVDRLGVGVDDDAHPDASSSLARRQGRAGRL
ncbi:DUF2231 domain-containing protein [Actinoplanes sp. NPDC051343]|uniref:DUF2231 domain-containing protein n=1 Tax=Actinoplanes sp. NPDC051343 TaxID=3363906 RepID=UPI00378EBF5B